MVTAEEWYQEFYEAYKDYDKNIQDKSKRRCFLIKVGFRFEFRAHPYL
jgi:hypothetical protein